jgi:hypothetical protein
LAQHRRELAEAQERLLAQLRQWQQAQEGQRQAEGELAALAAQHQQKNQEKATLQRAMEDRERAAQAVVLSSAELRQRGRQLADEIRQLEQLPPPTKTLRYRTPVSQPVHAEELLFECKRGHVTFIDIGALLAEIRRDVEDKGKLLRTRWQVADVAGPVGAFRLHYTLERERDLLDALGGSAIPATGGSFRYGLSEWQIEPIAPVRGESLEAALAANSEFRQIVDSLDPQQTTVTFWVYPDSFALFRRLRDHLYEHGITVAGRPLPEGIPITSSRRGSVSRGQ